MTDPELVARWTSTGRGGRPVDLAPEVGRRFKYVAKPAPGWSGIVSCEVLGVEAPHLLRYAWLGDEGGDETTVTCRLERKDGGTRLIWEHTGFTGLGGFLMARLLGNVRRKMLDVGLTAVLDEIDELTRPRPGRA